MRFFQKYFYVKLFYICVDILLIYFSIFFACWLRENSLSFSPSFHDLLFARDNPFRLVFLLWIVSTILIFYGNRLYQTRREVLEWTEILLVFKSVFISSMVMILLFYVLKVAGFPRAIFALSALFMTILLSIWRVIKRMFVEFLVQGGYGNVNAIIIGAGKVGTSLLDEIKRRPGLGIKVIGFLDDFKVGQTVSGVKVLGKLSEFDHIARIEFIEKVFITIHPDNSVFLRILELAKFMDIAVRVVPQAFDLISGDFAKYNIGYIPILEYSNEQNFRRQFGKRLFDIIVSGILVTFLFIPFVFICLLIKLDSPGPVIYLSKRYGRKGKIFHMFKFRSMVCNADQLQDVLKPKNEADGPIFKIRKDPRITRMGRFLRRYSLDELPQIINVLKGEMSLVGPRPLPIDQIEKEDLRQLARLEVCPGITGLWQIRGRSDVSFERLLKWDIWYINNWSFLLDLTILIWTIPVVFKGKGAY